MQEKKRWKPGTFVFPLFILLLLVAAWVWRREFAGLFLDRESLRTWVLARGAWGRLVFAGLQAFQVIVFVIPGEAVQIAGGFVYGAWEGSFLSIVGITAGSLFNFMVGRIAGRAFVEGAFGGERLERIEAMTASGRASAIFFLFFLIPGIPKDALCYVAGISRLRLPAFFLISMLGRLPGIAGSAIIGASAQAEEWRTAFIVLGIAILLFLLGLLWREKLEGLIGRIAGRHRPGEAGPARESRDPPPDRL